MRNRIHATLAWTRLVNADELRRAILETIRGEDNRSPLSDDAITIALTQMGYEVTRRVVTKCRRAMDVPSSRQRREY